jgi:uncharacterized protein
VRKIHDRWVISTRDLVAELECSHRLQLEWAVLSDLVKAPPREESAELKLLSDIGIAHESRIAEQLKSSGSFLDLGNPSFDIADLKSAHEKTIKAIQDGIETIHQATFLTDDFLGFADFLILVKGTDGTPMKDAESRFIYDPVDAKSARSAKRAAVLQVSAYAAIMKEIGLAIPQTVHLWLGGDKKWSTPALDVIDLAEFFMKRVREKISHFTEAPAPLWAPPRESCIRCRWVDSCENGRKTAQDLSLIQGIRSNTRSALVGAGITTIDQMAVADDDQRPRTPKEVSKETFSRLREQANIQVRGRDSKEILHEIREAEAFGLMPTPSDGDIWFDMEGDPFANSGDGLEYMFGFLWLENGKYLFRTFDATSTAEEKQAFKDFIDYVMQRRAEFPNMHIYHYAAYEVSAMLRLAQRHGLYEFEVDKLIREGVFVDLYAIVRRAFRFSTESLSIKKIESIYWDGNRDKEVANAVGSVIEFERALGLLASGDEDGFHKILKEIKDYNQDDVDSTRQLDHWIRAQAQANDINIASMRPLAEAKWDSAPELERDEPIALQLLSGVPESREERSPDEQGLALLSAAISFHHREARPAWWAIFDRALKDADELEAFNDVIVPSNVAAGTWSLTGKQRNHRRTITINTEGVDLRHILDYEHIPQVLYEFAPEGFKTIQGSTRGFADATIIEINETSVILEESEKKGSGTWDLTPMAILPGSPIRTTSIEKVIRDDLGGSVVALRSAGQVYFQNNAWSDVLLRRTPRQFSRVLPKSGNPVTDITSALQDSDNSYIAVQGPPGTGKTYVGANVIVKLVSLGWKIGVVAQSHSVVEHLMENVKKINPDIPIAKKGQSDKSRPSFHVDDIASWAISMSGAGYLVGGTTWTFSRPEVRLLGLDLIVIDEAGQFSLANSLAVISAAKRALLLGDPQQLPQVSQGSHPEPVNESVLSHLLGSHKTMPDDLGYFLDTTFRLHPKLAAPVSRLQYEDRLHSDSRCERRELKGVAPGLHIVEVDHTGNTVSSAEEADELVARIPQIIGKMWTSVDSQGKEVSPRALEQSDILIVTGYNAQVRYLKSRLNQAGFGAIKVGTFDKFQGQEAPVVFVSMATSSSEDLPRGIEFLLSPNRLNVAISRAQWACFVIRSPQLSVMEPVSPDGMVMLGKFITLCKEQSRL